VKCSILVCQETFWFFVPEVSLLIYFFVCVFVSLFFVEYELGPQQLVQVDVIIEGAGAKVNISQVVRNALTVQSVDAIEKIKPHSVTIFASCQFSLFGFALGIKVLICVCCCCCCF
jgi:hypothetical protein